MISLPSLHTLDRAQAARIWLATEATDMRCGFDRLAERVRAVIGQDPLSGHRSSAAGWGLQKSKPKPLW
jgi:transposase